MSADKSKRDGQDRARMSGSEGNELQYFARKHGISPQQARDLIHVVGIDRAKLDAAAEQLKSK